MHLALTTELRGRHDIQYLHGSSPESGGSSDVLLTCGAPFSSAFIMPFHSHNVCSVNTVSELSHPLEDSASYFMPSAGIYCKRTLPRNNKIETVNKESMRLRSKSTKYSSDEALKKD